MDRSLGAKALELASRRDLEEGGIVDLNRALLAIIGEGDFESYKALCDPQLSCFEPETRGHLVEGTDFHKYYFDFFGAQPKAPNETPAHTTIIAPRVRWIARGRAVVVCFKRLVQRGTTTAVSEETRLWEFSSVGMGMEFTIDGDARVGEVLEVLPALSRPDGMTHLLKYTAGGSSETEWVRVDESKQLLSTVMGLTGIQYKSDEGGRWRMVHFHRADAA